MHSNGHSSAGFGKKFDKIIWFANYLIFAFITFYLICYLKERIDGFVAEKRQQLRKEGKPDCDVLSKYVT